MFSLKERLKNIVNSTPLELDGEAYKGKYGLDRNEIKKFIFSKLRGKIKNLDTGREITITRVTGKELAKHDLTDETYSKTIIHIPKIIENMQFLEEMKPDNTNANFDSYSYYITNIIMDGKPYTILSTIGKIKNEIYYDQNILDGTAREVFKEAENSDKRQYSRLKIILGHTDIKKGDWNLAGIDNPDSPTASTHNIQKNS